eukprot:Unigene7655_Nuclearia_a/m.23520 Unigene7655_Nuclearia_a/g.23520  ORF Unigene7655_Nuclearia_a/g.23520 Unigene7655_Nuclearia_a/m.23520 type:complete len:248 (+) Unigene7655_Nuclearia_a:202-945(+)
MDTTNARFRLRSYWDERFASEESYDWLQTYDAYRELLAARIAPRTQRILVLGCGNSTLSERMHRDGYTRIDNIDFSSVVIERMRARHVDLPGVTWHTMDMRALNFADGAFDVVLEKGTLDALFAEQGADPWNPSPELRTMLDESLSSVSRVLRHGGLFISISFGEPFFRRPLLLRAKYGWDLRVESVGDAFHYHVYTMCKGSPDAPREDAAPATTFITRTPAPGAVNDNDNNSGSDDDDDPFGKLDI